MSTTDTRTSPLSAMTNTASLYYTPTDYGAAHYESTPAGESIPVVIVGAGPVGLATALGLAQRGVKVSVVDGGTSASYGSRATCYSRHTVEICDRLGYGAQVEKRALGWVGGRSYYQAQEVLNFQMPQDEHNYRLPMFNLQQCEYEDIQLAKVVEEPNITMLWGSTLVGIETDEQGVTITVDMVDGERTLRADRVVASDGGRSRIRDLLGLTLKGTAYEGRYVIADIHWKSKLPTERRVWFDPPSNPGSTIIMHKQPDDIWRIDYQLLEGEDAEKETQREAIIERITKHLSWLEDNGTITKEPWSLQWHSFYKALALALPSFVHGNDRVIFAGDAAHMVPIFGVRGLNSGMEDADTLAWMLAAVTLGHADANLLHAYSQERHDAWEQNIANAGKSTLIMTPGTDGYRITRDALLQVSAVIPEFNHLINPRQSSATHALRSPLTVATSHEGLQVGAPLDDRKITVDGKVTSIHKLRGPAFGVYAIAPCDEKKVEAVAERLRKALPHEPTKVLVLREGADNGAAAAWDAKPGEVVIVRPDGIVLARGQADEVPAVEAWIQRGIAEAPRAGTPPAADPILLSEEQINREKVWLQLSEALDQANDKYKFLTQLSIVLGAQVGPEKVSKVISQLNAAVL